MKKSHAAVLPLLLAPAVALAFETVDTLPWPSLGRFPAYPREVDRPTDLWVQGGVMRDDNVVRSETAPQGDTIWRVGGGVRHEQRIVGRQRLNLEARADYYKFRNFDQLDHFAYSALADWRWEVGNQLAGSIGVGSDRRLVDIGELGAPVRDMLMTNRFFATGGYLLTPRVRLNAGVTAARGDRSVVSAAETRAVGASLGADYVSGLGNTIGVEYRTADGDARAREVVTALGTTVSNDYKEHELAAVATYALGAQLRTGFRLGRTKRTYDEFSGRDFSGTTGRANVEWLPGNKTRLRFVAYKEPRSILDVSASHTVVKGLTFGPSWAATAKLVLSAELLRERRTFEGDPALTAAGTPLRDELITGVRFGVGWEPVRHWQVSLAYDRGDRESNFAGRDYRYDAVTANVAWRY